MSSSNSNGTYPNDTIFTASSRLNTANRAPRINVADMQSDVHSLPHNHTSRERHQQATVELDDEPHENPATADNSSCNNCASLLRRVTRLEKQSEIAQQLFAQLIENRSQQQSENPPSSPRPATTLTPARTTAPDANGHSTLNEPPPTFDDLQEFYDFLKAELHTTIDNFSRRMDNFIEPIATLRRDVDSLFAWHQSVVETEDKKAAEERQRAKPEKVVRKTYTDLWKVDLRPKLEEEGEERGGSDEPRPSSSTLSS
jgi:hypothetical protein